MSAPADITLAVLAGGEGSRMGRPKGSLEIRGRPILLHVLRRLGWRGPTLLVTAPGREHPPGWEAFDHEVVDAVAGQGPLRGVLTAMEHAGTELAAVVTVDMPEVGPEQVGGLVDQLRREPGSVGAMYRRGAERRSGIEPFPSVWRRSAAGAIGRQLAAGRRAVHGLVGEAPVVVVPAAAEWGDDVWVNLNEPADLASYLLRSDDGVHR